MLRDSYLGLVNKKGLEVDLKVLENLRRVYLKKVLGCIMTVLKTLVPLTNLAT